MDERMVGVGGRLGWWMGREVMVDGWGWCWVDGMVGAVGGDSGVASPGLARKNATREN